MTECPAEDQGWTLAFTLCAKLPQKERSGLFGANLRQELESKGISVADDTELQSMMQDSFLCQCPVKIPEPDVKVNTQNAHWYHRYVIGVYNGE